MLRLIIFLPLILTPFSSQSQEDKLPNIIFITVDDLGWADLGCYGADLHETPKIDALADASLVFTNSYAAAPVCSPTRASLMTGKTPASLHMTIWTEAAGHERRARENHPFHTPQTEENLPLSEVTIAELVKEKGYLTAHIGKWHLGDLMHFPETQGFDLSFAASQRGAPPTFFYPYRGHAFGEYRFVTDMAQDADQQYFSDRQGEYLTDRLTDEAIKMISDVGSKPLFLNLNYYSVHTPIEAKESDVHYFQSRKRKSFLHQNETYAAMVRSIDDNVGRLIAHLKSTGLFNNTLLVVLSDNGGFVNNYRDVKVTDNSPLRSGKGSLYEGGIRIPTIISAPFLDPRPRQIDIPVSTIDYVPTLCDLLNIAHPDGVEGESFLSVLEQEDYIDMAERSLFWHYPHYYPTTTPVSAIRRGEWKLVHYLGTEDVELYNLEDDIGEERNVAKDFPDRTSEMFELLEDWKRSANAQAVTPNPNFKG